MSTHKNTFFRAATVAALLVDDPANPAVDASACPSSSWQPVRKSPPKAPSACLTETNFRLLVGVANMTAR